MPKWPPSQQAVSLLLLGVLAGWAGQSRADLVLAVDFSTQDESPTETRYSPNRVQSGFEDFSYGPEYGAGDRDQAVKDPPPTVTQTFGAISLTVHDPGPASNGLIFVDYGTVDADLGPLADDFVVPSGLNLEVTLSGLSAGTYAMATYHHLAAGDTVHALRGISVDTGSGATTVATDVPVSIGFSPASVSSATFLFAADGENDVLVTVQGDSFSTVRGVLNGFEVGAVPEPSAMVLLSSGLLVLLAGAWQRRRTPP